MKTTIFTHRPRVSLYRFSFCRWRHNRLLITSQWPNNCDTLTWIVISNSLDVDFIHGDINSRSCTKNLSYKIATCSFYNQYKNTNKSILTRKFNAKIKADPDSNVHGANMGPTWVLAALGGPHVGPMNLAVRGASHSSRFLLISSTLRVLWPIVIVWMTPSRPMQH